MFTRLLGLLAALLVGALSAGAAAAFTLTSDEGRFTVELPEKPSFKQRRIQRVKDGAIFESNEWRLDQLWITWQVSYRDHLQYDVDISADKIFNRLIQELLRGNMNRNTFRPWEIELLLDIEACSLRESSKREILRRYQRAVHGA